MGTKTPPTVCFDLQGTIVKVYRYLLGQYPNTMLSRMVSERTCLDKSQDAPLFIDRNADRFQYVLEYMRNGQEISLPITISRDGFLRDLEYFGFENVDRNRVTVEDYCHRQPQRPSPLANWMYRYMLQKIAPELDECLILAECCSSWVHTSGDFECIVASNDHEQEEFLWKNRKVRKGLYAIAESVLGNDETKHLFKQCMNEYGLQLKSLDFIFGETEGNNDSKIDPMVDSYYKYKLVFERF